MVGHVHRVSSSSHAHEVNHQPPTVLQVPTARGSRRALTLQLGSAPSPGSRQRETLLIRSELTDLTG